MRRRDRLGITPLDPQEVAATAPSAGSGSSATSRVPDEIEAFISGAVDQIEPEAASGFDWIPLNEFELQIYTIRHLQQHTGELAERLGTAAGLEIPWVGKGS